MNIFEKGLTKYLSTEQLEKIRSVKIGIGGAGGLGSNVALILCRCGFIHFEIVDKDVIEPSNLNRQQYFIDDIKKEKVFTLKEYMQKINPDAKILTHMTSWNKQNASTFFQGCPIIVEAFDHADCKHDFVEYYQDKTEIIVSGNGMAGLVSSSEINVKKMRNIFLVGDNTSNIEDGLPPMAPRVTLCAAKMADVILSYVLSSKN